MLCSILALALILERLFQLQTHKVMPPKVMEQAIDATRRGLAGEDSLAKLENAGLLGPVLASGLRCLQKTARQ